MAQVLTYKTETFQQASLSPRTQENKGAPAVFYTSRPSSTVSGAHTQDGGHLWRGGLMGSRGAGRRLQVPEQRPRMRFVAAWQPSTNLPFLAHGRPTTNATGLFCFRVEKTSGAGAYHLKFELPFSEPPVVMVTAQVRVWPHSSRGRMPWFQ